MRNRYIKFGALFATLVIMMILLVNTYVKADEHEVEVRNPESESDYDGYILDWTVSNQFDWDVLKSVTFGDGTIAQYEYIR